MAKQKVDRSNTLPSSPADRKKLMGFVSEAVNVKVMMDAQKDALKDIQEACLDEFPITKKLFNSIVNFEFKQNFQEVEGESNEIFEAYEKLKG